MNGAKHAATRRTATSAWSSCSLARWLPWCRRRVKFGHETAVNTNKGQRELRQQREASRSASRSRNKYTKDVRSGRYTPDRVPKLTGQQWRDKQWANREEKAKSGDFEQEEGNTWYLCNPTTAVCSVIGLGALAYLGLRGGGTHKRSKRRGTRRRTKA